MRKTTAWLIFFALLLGQLTAAVAFCKTTQNHCGSAVEECHFKPTPAAGNSEINLCCSDFPAVIHNYSILVHCPIASIISNSLVPDFSSQVKLLHPSEAPPAV